MSYQYLTNNLCILNLSMISTWFGKHRKYVIDGLESKKRGRTSNMTKKDKKLVKSEYFLTYKQISMNKLSQFFCLKCRICIKCI